MTKERFKSPVFDGVTFIQIGSNVGVMSNDPLSPLILENNWQGIFIEPVPHIFEKLKQNYAGRENLYFENVAVSNSRKTCPFYFVDDKAEYLQQNPQLISETGGPWGEQVGSFDRDHVLLSKPGLPLSAIKTIEVPCVTIEDILDKYRLKRLDVLHMDAEGHDGTILLSIDFMRIRPHILLFEHLHMGLAEYLACTHHLESNGYRITYRGPRDTMAVNMQFA
ncbi:MAG: FkbM family methyltransferase [Verrucomicrobia bacterium]|nr:FkbM family methyltransferase [Verrucomicrobiota bacterium]